MLSLFWFSIVLLLIWYFSYYWFIDEIYADKAYNIFLVAIVISLALSVAAWKWIFKDWYDAIYSWMPEDNWIIMALTSWIIMLFCFFVIYFLPPLIVSKIIKMNKSKKIDYYQMGKLDGFDGRAPKCQLRKYLAGYREGVANSGKKITLPDVSIDRSTAVVYIDPHSESKE